MRNRTLWDAIRAHPLPADAAGTSFAEQLAREHDIKPETALAAIQEYRRFIYLSALGEGRSVPSKAVDAVWHLHLTHTRDYWGRFVPEVLGGRAVHHTPGAAEGQSRDFADTVRRYKREFGEAPPKGIWARHSRAGGWAGVVFGLVWIAFWTAGATAEGVPLPLASLIFGLGLLSGGYVMRHGLGQAMPDTCFAIEIDIWSDAHGGDCADCGGCGD